MWSVVPTFGLLVLSLSGGVASGSPSSTTQRIDCEAVNAGILNVALAGTARGATRAVTLEAGESLDFTFRSVDSVAEPVGSLALVAGPGSPRRLLAGPAGTTAKFVAPMQGTFEFELAAEGSAGTTFTATCIPAESARQSGSGSGTTASPEAADLLAEDPGLELLPLPETTAVGIDPQSWRSGLGKKSTQINVPGAKPDPATLAAVRRDGLNVWLGANGQRVSLTAPPKASPKADASALSEGGLKYEVMPQIMVGALVQLDPQGPPSFLDRNWMAGPMTSVQLAPGISLDARAAWGETHPAMSHPAMSHPAMSHLSTGGPGSERHQVNAKLANTQTFGHWRFSSSMAVDYLEITRQSGGLSTGEAMGPQTVGSGHVNIRPELSYRIDLDGSTFIEPKAAISSLWGIESLSELAPGSGSERMHLKAEAGLTVGTGTGTTLQATGAVQEGTGDGTDVWSGRLQLKVPLR